MENESPVAVAEVPVVAAPFEGDDAPAKPADKPADKPKDETADLRRRVSELERNNQELSASERYWHGQVKGEPPGDEEGADGEPGPDDDGEGEAPTTEAFLDELNAKGPEAVAKELVRRGFVRKADVAKVAEQVARQIVAAERGKMTLDARIASEFPELKDEKSELFQETAKIFRANVEIDPTLKKSPAALLMAARQARAELKAKNPPRREPQDYREREDDDGTRRRIDAQRGDLGRGGGAPFEDEGDQLGPEHREVLDLFKKTGLTEKDYREERAKLGRRK